LLLTMHVAYRYNIPLLFHIVYTYCALQRDRHSHQSGSKSPVRSALTRPFAHAFGFSSEDKRDSTATAATATAATTAAATAEGNNSLLHFHKLSLQFACADAMYSASSHRIKSELSCGAALRLRCCMHAHTVQLYGADPTLKLYTLLFLTHMQRCQLSQW
jgi:hypothetical protein